MYVFVCMYICVCTYVLVGMYHDLPGAVVARVTCSLPGPTPVSVIAKTTALYFDDCSKGSKVTCVPLTPEIVTGGLGVVMLALELTRWYVIP